MSRVAAAALCLKISLAVVALMTGAARPLPIRVLDVTAVMHRINQPGKPSGPDSAARI